MLWSKVDVPNLDTDLKWSLVFEWYVIRRDSKMDSKHKFV